jgi:hypothetical protein
VPPLRPSFLVDLSSTGLQGEAVPRFSILMLRRGSPMGSFDLDDIDEDSEFDDDDFEDDEDRDDDEDDDAEDDEEEPETWQVGVIR